MRRAARVDRNQEEIVRALRKAGATVQSLARVGDGCPDLLVGKGVRNFLLEVKDGTLIPSRQALTLPEQEWIDTWRGQACVVTNVEEALAVIGVRASQSVAKAARDANGSECEE